MTQHSSEKTLQNVYKPDRYNSNSQSNQMSSEGSQQVNGENPEVCLISSEDLQRIRTMQLQKQFSLKCVHEIDSDDLSSESVSNADKPRESTPIQDDNDDPEKQILKECSNNSDECKSQEANPPETLWKYSQAEDLCDNDSEGEI